MTTATDPFGEGLATSASAQLDLLGTRFDVTSTDAELLQLAVAAFGDLPRHRLNDTPATLNARLVLTNCKQSWPRGDAPPRPILSAGNGWLLGVVDGGNYAVVDPATGRTLVCVSKAMLRQAYYARYELLEFAFLTLASRTQSLVPLHGACFGARGKGVLILGASGTGKSTLSLHALANGLQLLSEDSAFVAEDDLSITGVPNYVYVQRDSLAFLPPGELRQRIRRSPRIQRRSGVRKYQADLRTLSTNIPSAPLKLAATVILTRRTAGQKAALHPLSRKKFLTKLRREQPYATGMPNWLGFEERLTKLPYYELRRTDHPDAAIKELRKLLS